MRRLVIAAILLVVVLMPTASALAGSGSATTVLLVRHAEKVLDGGSDPALTEEGRAHAEKLATSLKQVELAAIFSTPFRRTRDTAAPSAAKAGIETTITEAGPGFVERLAERILKGHRGQTVLVVGHSNTIGPTLAALGAGPSFELDESDYGDLFICTIPEAGEPSVVRLEIWD